VPFDFPAVERTRHATVALAAYALRMVPRRPAPPLHPPTPPPSRTNWTRLVPPPVLSGHVSSTLTTLLHRTDLILALRIVSCTLTRVAPGRARARGLNLRRAGGRRLRRPSGWQRRRRPSRLRPPPLPTVAPTRVSTVHSLPPSLLLPLPVSLLYTHSLPPYCCPYPCLYCTLTSSLPAVAPTRVSTVHSLPPSLLLPLPVSLLYTHSLPPEQVAGRAQVLQLAQGTLKFAFRVHQVTSPGTNRTRISPPPRTNRTRISPPPRTNRTRISPPPRTNRTHRRGAQGAAYVRAPGQVTERLRSLGVVEKPWAPTPSPWNLC